MRNGPGRRSLNLQTQNLARGIVMATSGAQFPMSSGLHGGVPPMGPPHARVDDGIATEPAPLARETPGALGQVDGPPMDQPGPLLVLIGAVGLALVAAPFALGIMLQAQPEAPAGAVNVSPAAQQPIRNEEGEPLPIQPGEPAEDELILDAPTAAAQRQPVELAAPPTTPPAASLDAETLPDAARSGEPSTRPRAD
jgi:hypothetical protein